MFRNLGVLIISTASIVTLHAGGIQIGQTVSGINDGLTTTYVTGVPSSANGTCGSGCVQGSVTGSTTQKNYDSSLFLNATPTPSPFAGYTNTAATADTAGSTMFDSANNVTFQMVSQVNSPVNYWGLLGTSPSITVPIGVFGVSSVWTMLNDIYGVNGTFNTSVTFTFDNNQNGSDVGSLNTVVVDLVNGAQIRSATDCTDIGSTCTGLTYAKGLSGTSNLNNLGSGAISSTLSTIQVLTNNLYSTGYTNSTVPYANTNGNLSLDDQGFQFGNAFMNEYLVSVKVTDNSGASLVSRAALSAITVESPEPSTIFLFMSGFGALGLARFRRK